jgi:tRNA modification GTPase
MSEPSTLAACLTPPGTGAIAVIAVRGPKAWDVIRRVFRPAAKPLPDVPEVGSVRFGHFGDGGVIDEVVLTAKQIDPLPWLELHCHGGRQVVDWLLQLLAERGVTVVPWERFVDSPVIRELAHALTARTAAILLDQLNGAFDRALEKIRRGEMSADDVVRYESLGRHLTSPWRVVVAGPPNVGKSSLVNALAGYQRSVVAPIAGTTRDVVSTTLAIDGWPLELFDTAGLRESASGLERAGIELAEGALRSADLVLWLIDASAQVGLVTRSVTANERSLTIANKCDLPAAKPVAADLRISALTGEGIPALCAVISRKLVPDPPSPGAAVPFVAEQAALLRQTAPKA